MIKKKNHAATHMQNTTQNQFHIFYRSCRQRADVETFKLLNAQSYLCYLQLTLY